MARRGRKIGGSLAIVGGSILAVFGVMFIIIASMYVDVMLISAILFFLVGAVLALLGGILLLLDKWIGGFFPILMGSALLVFFLVPFQLHFENILMDPVIMFMSFENLLMLIVCVLLIVGGILGIIYDAEESLTIDYKLVKIIGGMLAFTAAILIFLVCIFESYQVDISQVASDSNTVVQWVINTYIMVIAMTGATLGLLRKRLGGILLTLAGLTAILLPLIAIIINDSTVALIFNQYSAFWGFSASISGFNLVAFETLVGGQTIYITIESLLLLAGGIIILIASAKEKPS